MNKFLKIFLLIIVGLAFFYLITIPWRNYIAGKEIERGNQALVERKYTLAYVHFEKSALLKFKNDQAKEKLGLSKNASRDILALRPLLEEQNKTDLLSLISTADSKICNLATDRQLIEKDLEQVAIINLEFCTKEGPKDYDSFLFLGIANQKASENGYIFSDQKPEYQRRAVTAFEAAYDLDPLSKDVVDRLIFENQKTANQEKVDYWKKIRDNLDKIEK